MRTTQLRGNGVDIRDPPCRSVGVANNSAAACVESLRTRTAGGVVLNNAATRNYGASTLWVSTTDRQDPRRSALDLTGYIVTGRRPGQAPGRPRQTAPACRPAVMSSCATRHVRPGARVRSR